MSLLAAAEVFAAYMFGGALLILAGFAAWDWLRDKDAQRRIKRLVREENSKGYYQRLTSLATQADLERAWRMPAKDPRA